MYNLKTHEAITNSIPTTVYKRPTKAMFFYTKKIAPIVGFSQYKKNTVVQFL